MWALLRFLAPKWQRTFEQRVDEEALARPARDKWAELYYCENDGIVFLPGQKHFASPTGIKEFCLDAASRERNRIIDSYIVNRTAEVE